MDPIRTLIVDDEPLARENLRIRLRTAADFKVVGECANGREAIAAVASLRPDLVFLDIRMPDMDGFGVVEQIAAETMPAIVFVTAYDRFALDAFRVHALDYLLKPFDDDRFTETLDICRRRIAGLRGQPPRGEPRFQLSAGQDRAAAEAQQAIAGGYLERLIIKCRGLIRVLRTQKLDWISADGDYVRLHAQGHSYLLRKTMNEMEARLDPRAFARISRSAIVNLERIVELTPIRRGEYLVRLDSGHEVKLTRSYRSRLAGFFGNRL